jgi:glucose/arabinose dehydrogenase
MRPRTRVAALLACALAIPLLAAPRAGAVELQQVGSFNNPTYVTAPPGDPRLFVIEREGRIRVLHDGVNSQFLDIHTMVATDGERGLMSMAFDPNYALNGLFYVFYADSGTAGADQGDIHIDEFHVGSDPNVADPGSRRQAITIDHSVYPNHNGGQLQFGKDGLLYISVGDAHDNANPQDLSNPLGKVLRIDPHGAADGDHAVPADNPFLAVPGAVPEIWSYGLRNPFRFSFDHLTGDFVLGDVGQGQYEEVDFGPVSAGLGRGANYGWPCREGFAAGLESCTGAFTDPVFAYQHPSDPSPVGYAIIGGYVYRGSQAPELAGRYLYTDLGTGQVRSIRLGLPLASDDRAETPLHALGTPVSFGEDSNCGLYVTSGNSVLRIVGSAPSAAPSCSPSAAAATPVTTKKKKCKKRKKKRAAEAAKHKKHKKKHCKRKKKKKKR